MTGHLSMSFGVYVFSKRGIDPSFRCRCRIRPQNSAFECLCATKSPSLRTFCSFSLFLLWFKCLFVSNRVVLFCADSSLCSVESGKVKNRVGSICHLVLLSFVTDRYVLSFREVAVGVGVICHFVLWGYASFACSHVIVSCGAPFCVIASSHFVSCSFDSVGHVILPCRVISSCDVL